MEEKQQVLMPSYVKDFKCIGGDCKINCCSYGWGIVIDKNTYLKYKSIKEPKYLADLVKNYIIKNKDGNYIVKHKIFSEDLMIKRRNERNEIEEINVPFKNVICPFEDTDKLCIIQKELNYNYLSDVCKVFPRIYNNLLSSYELSLSTGCEVVCEILYNIKDSIQLEINEQIIPNNKNLINKQKINLETLEYLDAARIICFQILQHKDLSLDNRMILLSIFLDKIYKLSLGNNYNSILQYINSFFDNIDCYRELFTQNSDKQGLVLDIFNGILAGTNSATHKDVLLFVSDILLKFQNSYNELSDENKILKSYNKYRNNLNKNLKGKEHFIENVFVNLFFAQGYPFNPVYSIEDSLSIFILNYVLYKCFLTFYFGDKENIEKDELIEVTVIFSRLYAYQNLDIILKEFKKQKLNSLAHLISLIQNS